MSLPTFKFRWIPFLAMLAGMALFIQLGLWQSGKGDRLEAELGQRAQRQQLGPTRLGPALVDAAAVQDAPITVTGVYEPERQFFLDNRQENNQPGVHVITPLRIEGSQTRILVNRGWVGWTHGRAVLPVVDTPAGPVQIRGLAFVPSTKKFFLMPERVESDPRLRERLDLAHYAAQLGQPLQPVVLLQDPGDARDNLVRHWPPPENRVGMHRGYAFQWFGMAVALLLFYLVAGFHQGSKA